jgi:RNase P subunit RPR2
MDIKKHSHKAVDKMKGQYKRWICPKCKKMIVKGKETPNKAFGTNGYN